jgi:hypothetical protein
MKSILISLLFLPVLAFAQSVDVKNVDASDETTTVEIHKGKANATPTPNGPLWEVQDGTAEVAGDEAVTPKEARAAWKKACTEWKADFKKDNKENKIISMNCGTAECSGEVGSKTCTSKASYKIKTKLN